MLENEREPLPTAPTSLPTGQRGAGWAHHLGLERYSGVYVLGLIIVIFSLLEPHTFPTIFNLKIILASEAVTGLIALAVIFPLAADLLDLSFVGTMTLCVSVSGWLATRALPISAIIAGTLAVAALIGLVNAFLVIHFRVPTLIATLGMGSITPALATWLSNGQDIVGLYPHSFASFGQFFLWGIPAPVYYLLAMSLILYYLLDHTSFGRQVRATGGNTDAARLAGVNVARITVATLTVSALVAGFAALVYSANLGSAPLDAGTPYFAGSFAVVLLGSTQITPGRINVWGAILALFMLATGVKGLQLVLPNSSWLSDLFNGVGLIVAVVLALRRGTVRPPRRWRRAPRALDPATVDQGPSAPEVSGR